MIVIFIIFILRKVFPEGATIVYDGEDFLCETCDNLASPKKQQMPSEEIERRGPPSYEHHVQSSTPQKESVDITDSNTNNDDTENCEYFVGCRFNCFQSKSLSFSS